MERAAFPHCNSDVLHAPGVCHYCDAYPERQALRSAGGTPFTPPESNGWSGNVAVQEGETHTHMGATYVVGESESPGSKTLRRKLLDLLGRN